MRYKWTYQECGYSVLKCDEEFADQRSASVGDHAWEYRPNFAPRARRLSIVPSALAPIIVSCTNKPLPLSSMSQAHATTASSSSDFQSIIDNALDKYKKRTKNDLTSHPLATRLQSCNSPTAIVAVLQQLVQDSSSSDGRWSRWLDPTVNVIYALSSTVAAGVGLVRLFA